MKYLRFRAALAVILMAAGTFGAASAAPTHRVVIISGEYEYGSRMTLGKLADQLKAVPGLEVTFLQRAETEHIPGIEAVAHADLLITFIRRMTLPESELKIIQDYLRSGHPLLGLRTTCHAFQNWKEFDHEVLGGNYQDHYRPNFHARHHVVEGMRDDPRVAGVPSEYTSSGTLYKVSPLAADTQLLIYGTLDNLPGAKEPVAWTRMYHGGRIYFTSLGDPDDFTQPALLNVLADAMAWTLQDPSLQTSVHLAPIEDLPPSPFEATAMKQFVTFGSYTVMDVRPAADFKAGHLKKAVNFDAQAPDFTDRLKAYSNKRFVALYSDSGEHAAAAAQRLHELGFKVVFYLDAPYKAVAP
jgi:type 1 glutamine amidotransferase/rhodanese-related sulfurtransferase